MCYLWMNVPFLDECAIYGWMRQFWMKMSFLDEFLWILDETFEQISRTCVKKVEIDDFWSKSENLTFISMDKKPSRLTSKNLSESRRLFTSGSWKSQKWNRCNFLDVYDVFASKFCHFSHLSSKMKVNHVFKAKKEAFRERNRRKWKMNHFELIWPCKFSIETETTFWCTDCKT